MKKVLTLGAMAAVAVMLASTVYAQPPAGGQGRGNRGGQNAGAPGNRGGGQNMTPEQRAERQAQRMRDGNTSGPGMRRGDANTSGPGGMRRGEGATSGPMTARPGMNPEQQAAMEKAREAYAKLTAEDREKLRGLGQEERVAFLKEKGIEMPAMGAPGAPGAPGMGRRGPQMPPPPGDAPAPPAPAPGN